MVAEISTLEHIYNPVTGRLYDDACDEGFIIVSKKTGEEATFYLKETLRSNDIDDEINSWVFAPTIETLQRHPNLRGWFVEVLND
jgi:hypothetical protein